MPGTTIQYSYMTCIFIQYNEMISFTGEVIRGRRQQVTAGGYNLGGVYHVDHLGRTRNRRHSRRFSESISGLCAL